MHDGSGLLDKLHVLDYEKDLIKIFSFLVSLNPNFEFFYFGNLVNWLLLQLGNNSFPIPGEFDDPNVISSNIVNSLKEIGLEDIPHLKLKTGTGSIVIQVLESLVDLVLKEKAIVFSKPIFKADDKTEDAIVDDAEITTNLDIDEKEWEESEEEEVITTVKTNAPNTLLKAPIVNVEDWNLQVERVTPLLKSLDTTDSRNWRMHLEAMNFHFTKINSIQESILGSTTKLSSDIEKSLEKIKSREKYLSSQFESFSRKYLEISSSISEFKQEFQEANSQVSSLSETLSAVSEELDSIKSRMDEIGSGMTDSKPLLNIKSGVLQLKSEIKTMDLRIGVMEHSLMQNKLNAKPNFLFA